MKRIAFVTGGTRGIGAGVAVALKMAGYSVAVNYRSNTETAKKFSLETGIPAFQWDVADYQSCADGLEKVYSELGGDVDVLVNNVGIVRDSMLHKMTLEDWAAVLAVNLSSVFNMCRLVVPSMRERRYGRIINISSVNGQKGQIGQTNYSSAKAGVIGFTKSLALESASKGITVNAVAPGYVSTDMTDVIKNDIKAKIMAEIPVGRFGTVEEIAESVLFLASEKASFITGAVLSLNGGQYL
jgi:acetoacetyl-CoA reductase